MIELRMLLFVRDASAWFFWYWCTVYDSTDISLYVTHLSFQLLILDTYPVKSGLKQYIHRIEKERHVEYRIEHRHDLACDRHRNQITEPDRRCRDDREVESIEIVLTNRMPCLEPMDQKCPNNPRRYKYEGYRDELAMVDMESHNVKWEIGIIETEYM